MQRDLNSWRNRLKKSSCSSTKTNAVFHLGSNNPVKQPGLRTDRSGGSFAEKELGVLVADRLNVSSSAPLQQCRPTAYWAKLERVSPAGRGR